MSGSPTPLLLCIGSMPSECLPKIPAAVADAASPDGTGGYGKFIREKDQLPMSDFVRGLKCRRIGFSSQLSIGSGHMHRCTVQMTICRSGST